MVQWFHRLLKSFQYAFEGIVFTVKTQRNMKIHVFATILVVFVSIWLQITSRDWVIILSTVTFVLVAEMINTAIEKMVDLITEKPHPYAKIAKDVAAGAVFLAASLSVIVGILIFYPYIKELIL